MPDFLGSGEGRGLGPDKSNWKLDFLDPENGYLPPVRGHGHRGLRGGGSLCPLRGVGGTGAQALRPRVSRRQAQAHSPSGTWWGQGSHSGKFMFYRVRTGTG